MLLRFSNCLSLVAPLLIASALASGSPTQGTVLSHNLTLLGSRSLSAAAPSLVASGSGNETRIEPLQDRQFDKQITGSLSAARVPAANVPRPSDSLVVPASAYGFDGLTVLDQRLADSGNQFTLEPPDQGLAVGAGFVVEAVNLAVRVRSTTGAQLTSAIALNRFFGLPSAIDRGSTPPVYGPFLSDPKVYYDSVLNRFFLTVLQIDTDPSTGALVGGSSILIAVSQTSNPTAHWYLYRLNTVDDGTGGTPSHPGCPCFGDQPLIGADEYGFFVTTNEFPIFNNGFNGAQVYALSKTALASGVPPTVVAISPGALEEGQAYSLQPATVPPRGTYESANNGTEYFLSALDFNSTLDNRVAAWALTGTATLSQPAPAVSLTYAIAASQVYGQPPAMQQKDGPLPLADAIRAGQFGKPATEHLPLLDSNDDRMQQTVFVSGQLWSALNTVVKPHNGPVRSGIAWFAVQPSWTGGKLSAAVSNQNYIAVDGNNLAFPSVALNSSGRGIVGFTLVGPDYYPSAAYTTIELGGTGDVLVGKAGAAPDDGFTGYVTFGGRVGRWGDYSAASSDEDGNIWFATEYIPASPRTVLANWGTFIGQIKP